MICTMAKDSSRKDNCLKEGQFETLADIVNPIPEGFQPIGRLDRHSHGLLLFSTDGRLTSALLSPRTCIPRVYEIIVRGDVGNENDDIHHEIMRRVKEGVQTDYGFFEGTIIAMKRDVKNDYAHQKCSIDSGGRRNDKHGLSPDEFAKKSAKRIKKSCSDRNVKDEVLSCIRVEVKEGKKRQVRRLFAALDLFVLDLQRIKYGNIDLGDVSIGSWRFVNCEEATYCQKVVSSWVQHGAGWDKMK